MLELKSISKTFNPGTVNEKCALHDLSLSVPDGDFITIIGANGAGKSTLFGAIGGNFLTDGGEILLQKAVEVLPDDTPETLQRRVMEQAEWLLLPRAAELVSEQIVKEKSNA